MQYVRRFLRQDRDYFSNNLPDIQRQNGMVLRISCAVYMAVLVIYTVITVVTGASQSLSAMYFVFDALHLILCGLLFFGTPGRNNDPRYLHFFRIYLEVTLLGFFMLEAVFAFDNAQSIYFSFPIVLLVMLFIYDVKQALILIFSYVGVFVALVCVYKSGVARVNDLYIAAGTLLSSLIGYAVVASLRHETGEAMNRLRYLSMTDALTGLYNKQTFESLCRAFLEDNGGKRGYAILFLDIDRFKQINDRFGHPMGDRVLKNVGALMRDTFYEKDYLCRFGGDEFVVLMIDIESKKDVTERLHVFSEKVRALSKTLPIGELSCSVGVAMKAGEHETYAELLSRADAALYVVKRSGDTHISFAEQYFKLDADAESPVGEAGALSAAEPRKRVLIVDDNEINRQVLRKILSFNYDTIEAENGQLALDILHRESSNIAAVLLDIVMPVMDGYTVLSHMQQDEALAKIPVIVTTGNGEEEAEIRSLSLGASDFIAKPYRPAIIMRRLQNVANHA